MSKPSSLGTLSLGLITMILLLALGFLFPWQIDSDLLNLVTKAKNPNVKVIGQQAYEQHMSRKIILALEDSSWETLKAAVSELHKKASASGLFDHVQKSVVPGLERQLWNFYKPHRHQILAIDRLAVNSGGKALVQSRLAQIYSPWGQPSQASLQADPLGLLSSYLARLAPKSPLVLREGFFTAKEKKQKKPSFRVFLFATLKLENTGSLIQKGERLNQMLQTVAQDYQVQVLRWGAPFYAEAGVRQGFDEARWIGGLSLMGVLSLLLLTFRSFAFYALTALTLVSSGTLAAVITHLIFGRLHLFALIAGTSLLGIGADYIFHFGCTPLSPAIKDGSQALRALIKPIVLSFTSSVLGYSALLFVPLPGLQQLATFIILGLSLTLMAVLLIFPRIPFSFFEKNIANKQSDRKIFPSFLTRIPASIFLSILTLLLMILVNTPSLFNDRPQTFQGKNVPLQTEEARLRKNLNVKMDPKLVLFWNSSIEKLLQAQEAYFASLPKTTTSRFLAQVIPSKKSQKDSQKIYNDLSPYRDQIFKAFNIQSSATEPKGEFLTLKDFRSPPLTFISQDIWTFESDGIFYSVASTSKFADSLATAKSSPASEASGFVNYKPFSHLRLSLQNLRTKLLLFGLLGAGVIFLFLSLRTRLTVAFFLLIAPLSGVMAALVSGLLVHGALNIFHILACFLVFSLGLDYSLFHGTSGTSQATRRALWASFLTTAIAFGALSLSQTLAVSAFGLSLLVGLIVSYLLAPVAQRCTGKF